MSDLQRRKGLGGNRRGSPAGLMPSQRDQSRLGRSGCLRKLATSVLDALHQYRERLRGITVVVSQTGKEELATLDRSAWSESDSIFWASLIPISRAQASNSFCGIS
jgi:hypothetical protein